MQATVDLPTTSPPTVIQADTQHAVRDYVASAIDPAFEVVSDAHFNRQPHNREVWRFYVRCEHGPLSAIEVNVETGQVIPFTDDENRIIREKAAVFAARKQGVLPVNAQGHVLGEYARRKVDRYLGDQIGMYFEAADPVFVPGEPPRWQVTIVFKRYYLGPFTLGVMDVDAQTGEPILLTKSQLKRICERAHALVEFYTPAAAA